MSVETDRAAAASAAACPCHRGADPAAEVARLRPLLERATRGDREAFARLFLTQVDGVSRYLLAWTGDQAAAKDLTGQVFRAAQAWLPVTAGGGTGVPHAEAIDAGDIGAWLVALARDAVAQRRQAGWVPEGSGRGGPGDPEGVPRRDGRQGGAPVERGPEEAPADPLAAVTLLGDPEREVVVLRLLLGHSVAHAAQLSGYSQRAVTELQLAACLAIRRLMGPPRGDGPTEPAPPAAVADPGPPGQRAAEFQRRLERWDLDLVADDPELADALAVAAALRQAAPSLVVAPDRGFVLGLREALASDRPQAAGDGPLRRARLAWAALRVEVARRPRPFAATAVAAAAILVIFALQAFGSPRPPACGGRPCPPTSIPAAAPASATAAPLTSLRQATTTTGPPPTTAPAAVSTAPPATSPPSTAPRTTRPPRTTTTRRPTTTAATTTSTTTATTGPTTTTG
jgi:DNA-directed RNA polymerase specialized sigma24 family protein